MVFGRCVQAGGDAMVFDRGCFGVGPILNKANQVT
jgi:hypothetical protein